MTSQPNEVNTWTESELSSLKVEDQFRLRGLDVTRLETLVDAAFAFAITLLVISFDRIPSSYADMQDAILRVPAFTASFAILMWFWLRHRRWSRRYGFENSTTVVVSILLILVVMIYVYPLRITFEALFASISGGFLPSDYRVETTNDLRGILTFYSAGFCAMTILFGRLYFVTLRNSDILALNQIELHITRTTFYSWLVATGFSILSILLAQLLPDRWVAAAGYLYFMLGPAMSTPAAIDKWRVSRQ